MALLKKLGYKDMGYLPDMESQVFGKWTTPATELEIWQAINNKDNPKNITIVIRAILSPSSHPFLLLNLPILIPVKTNIRIKLIIFKALLNEVLVILK